MRRSIIEKEEEMLDDGDNIVIIYALDRLKSEAKSKAREVKEVSAEIRARIEAERSERERADF